MSKFMRKSSIERYEEMSLTRPIPGESLTVRPGKFPYERPAQFTNPEEAVDHLIEKFLEPRTFNAIVAILDAGAPLDLVVTSLIRHAFEEGMIDPRTIPIVSIPITVMFMRICESAKIDFALSTDATAKPDISEAEITARLIKEQQKAANAKPKAEKAMKDVKRMMGKEGLMTRPEAFV